MDLRTALSLKDEVEAALERLVGAVRVRPAKAHPLRAGCRGRLN